MGNPCSYGWENMNPANKGRHCAQCDKVVLDFTSMSDEELIHFLLRNKNVCGHFNKTQLNRPIAIEGPKKFKMPQWPAVAAMLVAGLFSVAPSVHAQTELNGNIAIEQPQKLYPRNSSAKYTNKDSTVTIGIKIVDSKTKKPLAASLTVNGQNLESDKIGCFSLTVNLADLPEMVSVQAYAVEHRYYSNLINVAEFRKKPYYILELGWEDPNWQVDGGDIYLEPQH